VFQLWQSASTCCDRVKFNCWIYQVALSTAIASNTLNLPKRLAEQNKRPTQYDPKDQLIDVLKQLTDDDKAIFMLYLEDLTYPEIAEITGIAETIVGVKLNRIKKKVQQLVNVPPKEQYPIKSIWCNIDTSQKSEEELRSMISARPSPVFRILNNMLPNPLSKSLATNGDLKRSLEDQLAKIKSYAILSITSRVIAAGCLLLLARVALTNSQAMRWVIALTLLIFITHIVLLSITWVKRARQMKYTIDHLRCQREFIKEFSKKINYKNYQAQEV
jgi:hypothetical protein